MSVKCVGEIGQSMIDQISTETVTGLGTALACAGLWYGAAPVGRRAQVHRLRAAFRTRLLLSYDDGPDPGITPTILDLLSRRDAIAAFFLQGAAVRLYPELVLEIARRGHLLGSHGFKHIRATRCVPGVDVNDLVKGHRALLQLVSVAKMYRPPYGRLSLGGAVAMRGLGARPLWWTRDSGDTRSCLPTISEERAGLEGEQGGVVLLHDFARTGSDASERHEYVVEYSAMALDLARSRGWDVRTGFGVDVQ